MLARSPGFTAVVILIIGLGIGANTAIFNALDQISLRPLPVEKADDLVSVQYLWRSADGQSGKDGIYNYPVYEAYRDQSDVFSGLIGFTDGEMRVRFDDKLAKVQGLGVTGNYFSILGVKPALGRLFDAEREQDTEAPLVAVVSHAFWRRQFEGKRDVIGEQVVVNDRSLTIIGVAPAGFHGTIVGRDTDIYVPAGTVAGMWNISIYRQESTWLYLLGRLKPGIGRDQAQESLRILTKNLRASGFRANVHENVVLVDGSRGWTAWEARDVHRPIVLFMVAAAALLVIMAGNIANMQLSRSAKRQKEIAIRQALGAGRWVVVRQLLVESLILALAGGLVGIVLAIGLDRITCVLMARIGSVSMIPGLDLRGYLFALAVSLLVGLMFGLTPALQMVRRNVIPALKESASLVELPTPRWNLHHLLVVFQVAIVVTILICTGFFVRSGMILDRIDPRYDTTKLLGVSVKHSWMLGDRPDLRRSFSDLRERVGRWPGVETTCLANLVPLGEAGAMRGVTHIDGVEVPAQERSSWWYGVVGPEYFKILNMPLLAGRTFTDQDSLHTPRVMVINDIMAGKYWPNRDPLGSYVTFRGGRQQEDFNVQVIGVVRACKMRSIIEGERPIAYWPLTQADKTTPALLIRTTGDPKPFIPMIQKEVAAVGFNEICDVSTVSDRVAELLYPQRAVTTVLSTFGLIGLLLCVIGLYSMIAFAVRQRTREIGIRMALGAESRHVIVSVLGKGACLTAVGLGLGLGTSCLAVRLLAYLLTSLRAWNKFVLYGVSLWDISVFAVVLLLVSATALLASYLPARRAAKIDPMEALRYE
jgi:predicted permease